MSSVAKQEVGAESSSRRIVFAGGGTAGHVEPAIAVARNWKVRHGDDQCIFIGTDAGLEKKLVPSAGFELRSIEKVTMPRGIGLAVITLPFRLLHSVRQSRQILKGADLLIGFGGYVSASAYIAAKMEKVSFIVHEANAKPGWANILGAYFSPYIAITHRGSKGKFKAALPTGLPLRADVEEAAKNAAPDWKGARLAAKEKLGLGADKPTILVLGGSQGSVFINTQLERSLATLIGQGFQVIHSVGGKNDLPPSSNNYRALAYIQDMATAYLAADVVIARSGAVTCAEFATLGRSAIFIPLPTGNGEQARNADFLVEAGRAVVIAQSEFSADWLIRNIGSAVERAGDIDRPGLTGDLSAASTIVTLMEEILEKQR